RKNTVVCGSGGKCRQSREIDGECVVALRAVDAACRKGVGTRTRQGNQTRIAGQPGKADVVVWTRQIEDKAGADRAAEIELNLVVSLGGECPLIDRVRRRKLPKHCLVQVHLRS